MVLRHGSRAVGPGHIVVFVLVLVVAFAGALAGAEGAQALEEERPADAATSERGVRTVLATSEATSEVSRK